MKFQCQESCGGKCCKLWQNGQAGFVFLTPKDRMRLSAFLKKPVTDFADQADFDSTRFKSTPSRQWYLKRPAVNDEFPCQFLNKGKCSVYEARPTQCRTFPFWPENSTAKAFNALGEHCPGIGQGEELEQSHVDIQIMEQESADAKLRSLSGN